MSLQNGTIVLRMGGLLSPVHLTLELQRALQRAMHMLFIRHLMVRHRPSHAMLVNLVLERQLQRWLLRMPHGTLHFSETPASQVTDMFSSLCRGGSVGAHECKPILSSPNNDAWDSCQIAHGCGQVRNWDGFRSLVRLKCCG